MLAAIFSGFVLSPATPWIQRYARGAAGWIIALLPLGVFAYFASLIGAVGAGETFTVAYAWVPSLGVGLSFYLDGLALLFALLISGIGGLVVIYTGGYLSGHRDIGRFYAYTLFFMASMIGMALADNAFTLFVFWELTTISSYLLIGFDHDRKGVRDAAMQALLVTGIGGLALFAGLLLLAQIGGSAELSVLRGQADLIRAHDLYTPALILILLGAFTKSAQVPFHFWLPNAMQAPTPASAYLHSATMVKAGVYLLARLSPILGGTDAWRLSVTVVGAATMLLGAWLAWQQNDLKRILAYSTVSALGMMTLMLGLNTKLAAEAMLVFLLSHALYKGALFLVAGAVDHETGTRSIDRLGGLRTVMPITAAAAIAAMLSMCSLPPFLGFIGKELFYESTLEGPVAANLLIALAVAANMIYIASALLAGLRPFVGPSRSTPKHAHEAPLNMWLGPATLAALGLLIGVWPGSVEGLIESATGSIAGYAVEIELYLWHGLNFTLLLSAITVAGGVAVYVVRDRLHTALAGLTGLGRWGAERGYDLTLVGVDRLAHVTTRLLQSGYLRYYVLTIVVTTVGLVGYTLFSRVTPTVSLSISDARFYEIGLAILIVLAALMAVLVNSRMSAIAALGIVGYSVTLIFVLFGAPDLAMTQFAVETLTVVIFVLVLYRLPRFVTISSTRTRIRDAVIALGAGGLITALILLATRVQFHESIAGYYLENSKPEAHGHNIVNVILVDFRGLDTMGEITVLSLAGIGVYALLKSRATGRGEQ